MIDKDARNKESDIVVGSVWQLLGSGLLVVVSNVDDGWVVKEQLDENGMRRTLSMDIPQFLSFYRLFYTPKERGNKYHHLREVIKKTQPILLD